MTLPLSGPLGFGDINEELDISIAEQLGLGEALARSLASTSANPPASSEQDTIIGVGNFYGAQNGLLIGYLIVGGGGGGPEKPYPRRSEGFLFAAAAQRGHLHLWTAPGRLRPLRRHKFEIQFSVKLFSVSKHIQICVSVC